MRFLTWGLSGTLATEHDADLGFAVERLWHWIDAIDLACNRFRADSEVSRLNARVGETVPVSDTLWRALVAARRSSDLTGGLCDATVLPALVALGYDRDYDELAAVDVAPGAPVPAAGMGAVALDEAERTATLPPGVGLDLGASAKALLADLVADDAAARGGVVVEVGGDVAVHGSGPDGPWAVGVSDVLELTGREPRVSVQGGLATSSLAVRTWRAAGRVANHIVDPRTGLCADGPYATATVSAADCVTANAFATAALLWGEDAAYHVAQAGWSARLVTRGGEVEYVGGWPADEAAP
jgi:FAD:protein FMN transferase